jgi:hypothetical protein
MYGIPKGTDLSFLEGCELLQVCVGEGEVILNFAPHVSIAIQSDVVIFLGEHARRHRAATAIGKAMLPFLRQSITEATGTTDGTLRLTWDSGASSSILDTWREYESYVIRRGQDWTLVV